MSDAARRALADPVRLIVDLLTQADPGLDPVTARDVVTEVAAGRAQARRLAVALLERPAVLADGRSPAPLVVGALLVALRAAGAQRICAPCCTSCRHPLRGSFAAAARTGTATPAGASGNDVPHAATSGPWRAGTGTGAPAATGVP